MIPCYQAYCGQCKFCKHPDSNLCVSVRAFTGEHHLLEDWGGTAADMWEQSTQRLSSTVTCF